MRKDFEHYSDFIDVTANRPNSISSANYYDGWSGPDGGETLEGSLKLARKGWDKGRSDVRAIANLLTIDVERPAIGYDVVGDTWDMGKVINGEPECAMLWVHEEKEKPIISVCVNTTVSAYINESLIRTRGAAILALIEAIELTGRRVELTCIFSEGPNNGWRGGKPWDIRVTIKHADEPAQDDMIAFAVAHPAFSRRFGHGVTGQGIYPGSPAGIEDEYDIYIPEMMMGKGPWGDKEKTLEWIKAHLKTYGIDWAGEED